MFYKEWFDIIIILSLQIHINFRISSVGYMIVIVVVVQ